RIPGHRHQLRRGPRCPRHHHALVQGDGVHPRGARPHHRGDRPGPGPPRPDRGGPGTPPSPGALAAVRGGITRPRPTGRDHRGHPLDATAVDRRGGDRFVTGAQPAPSTPWRSAFPQWDLVADQVPVSGDTPVAETSPEDRVETIIEIAAAFRGASAAALGELYPLVPAQFGLVLGAGQQPVTFATLAIRPSADVTTPLSRADGRRLHRTLAQVNAAAGAVSDPSWPRDPVLRAVSSAVFALAPERRYALIAIRLTGGDAEAATDYVS